MYIDRFIAGMELVAPPDLAEDFDEHRIGLVLQGKDEIDHVCCALDVTPAVVKQAVSSGADMIVVHHTPIWDPINSIRGRQASLLRPLLAAGINVYVMHTNFDHAKGGINDALARLTGLEDLDRMSLGVVGNCTCPLEVMVRAIGSSVRIYGEINELKRLAVVGGSGFDLDLMDEAVSLGADAYLSAELKHNIALAAPLPLIESTHYALEAPGMSMLAERMGWEYIGDPPRMVTLNE